MTNLTYIEIINKQRELLPKSTKWWPAYFYHFTDIHNAIGIIDKMWIYGRKTAVESNLMKSDNASENVISLTNDYVKNYARLYFRPKTPTQFHTEGYKPSHIRNKNINALCPVPIFFLFGCFIGTKYDWDRIC